MTMKVGPRNARVMMIGFIAVLLAAAGGCAKPKVQLQVSRERIQQGEDVRVSWTSKNAKNVTLNGETVDKVGTQVFIPDNTTTYTAEALRGKKTARDAKMVEVNPRPAKPTVTISADQSAILRGQSTELRWDSTNAERVTINDLGTLPPQGSRTVNPSQSTTYTAEATGPGGVATASTRVSVTEEESPDSGERPPVANPAVAALFSQWVQPIFFELDKAVLNSEARERLRRAAEWLTQKSNRTIEFRIEGNCDPRGTEEYNMGLGERRALAAKEFLISLGVDPSRIRTVSYGEEKAQGTSEGSALRIPSWAHDRRDDFVYMSGGETPDQ